MTSSNFNYEYVNSSSRDDNFPAAPHVDTSDLPLSDQQSTPYSHYAQLGLQPIVVNSSNNYNASCSDMNDNIFTVPAGQSVNNPLNLSSNNYNNMDASCNGINDNIFTVPAGQSINNSDLNLSSNNHNNMDAGMSDTFTIPGQQSSITSNESI